MSTSKPIDVLITVPFSGELQEILAEFSPNLHININPVNDPQEIPDETWEQVEVLYTIGVLPTPEQAPKLRWIQFHRAGVDHVLEAPIFKDPNLVATSLSGAAAPQVAEHVLAQMMALGHHLTELFELQTQATWSHEKWAASPPQELTASTVGIVGYGSIGRQIARLLQSFGATVLATKRNAMQPEDNGYTLEGLGDPTGDLVHRLYPPQALRTMLRDCDYVVVTLPLTAETHHLIGTQDFNVMKPSTLLVDVSRGGVIDQDALIEALRSNKIAGTSLDVFPAEPLPEDNPLWDLPNVIITPHIAGYSAFYHERAVTLFVENLDRYITKRPLLNKINFDYGY